MAEERAPKNASEILQSLHAFLIGPEEELAPVPLEQVQAELKDEGIDPNPLIKRVRERLAHIKAQERTAVPSRARILQWRLPRPSSALAGMAIMIFLVFGVSLWLWLQPLADARESSNPQPRSEGIEVKDKASEAWRFWQVLQDSLKDIVPSVSDQDDFLTQRRIIAMQYALRGCLEIKPL